MSNVSTLLNVLGSFLEYSVSIIIYLFNLFIHGGAGCHATGLTILSFCPSGYDDLDPLLAPIFLSS